MPRKPVEPAVRYRAKVNRGGPDDCWEWNASRFKNGYGQFGIDKEHRSVLAHRYGYQLEVGPVPPGLNVLHTCDNPPCQNPRHWFLGTHKDNTEDKERKGRGNHPRG